jgi:hypothetical protein
MSLIVLLTELVLEVFKPEITKRLRQLWRRRRFWKKRLRKLWGQRGSRRKRH